MNPLSSKPGSYSLVGGNKVIIATSEKEEAGWNPAGLLGAETDMGWIWALLCLLKSVLSFCICIWHVYKVLADLHHCTLLCSRMSNAMNLWAKLSYRLC